MRSLILLLFLHISVFGQITQNPKIKSKSASDVFINKIEINDKFTMVYMEFKSKTAEQQLEEYFKANPRQKRELQQLDRFTRSLYLNQLLAQIEEGSNFISIQPESYLKSQKGTKYKFIKAIDIPVSPNKKNVAAGKNYKFLVYFDKIAPGEEEIDLMENQKEKSESTNFWNFYGIKINNPLNPNSSNPATLVENREMVFSGKIFDAATNKTINAQIVCIDEKTGTQVDSVSTSKSGLFEFILESKPYVFKLKSENYSNSDEYIDLSKMGFKKDFKQDFYLEPLKIDILDKEPIKTKENEPVAEKVDDNTFRLSNVYFEVGEAVILPESYSQLNDLVLFLKSNPTKRIRIEGHTDNQGDSQLNKRLSLDRAFSVREYLVSRGISSKRIEFKGMGDTKPIAPNDSEENRKKNRRVEYVILED